MLTLSYAFWVVLVLRTQLIAAFMQQVQWWLACILVMNMNETVYRLISGKGACS